MDLLIDQHKTPDVTRKLGSVRGEKTYFMHVFGHYIVAQPRAL